MRARVLLAVLTLLTAPAVAAAHSRVQTVSADGDSVTLVLSASIEKQYLAVEGAGTDGFAVLLDPRDDRLVTVQVDPGPGPRGASATGEFELRVLSVDGHVTRQRIIVGSPARFDDATTRARGIAITADMLMFVGLLGMLGLIAIRCGVFAPARRGLRALLPDRGEGTRFDNSGEALSAALPRWWSLWWAFSAMAIIGLVLALVAQLRALDIGIEVGDSSALLLETRWGLAWIAQLAGIALAAVLASFAITGPPHADQWWEWLPAVPLAAVAIVLAWSGHAGSGTDGVLGITFDALHTIAAGAWLGGLVALLITLPRVHRKLATTEATQLGAAIVVRFSALAIICVGTLVVTGIYRGLAELRTLGDLTTTSYGQTLLVKIGVFVVLLIGGIYNRMVLHPRLERAAMGLADDDRGALARLSISIRAEVAVAAVLLVTVATLVNLPPP